ncbi:MAG: hypothetical protein U0271_04070 [Polyangiaceae bacterium]
MSEVLHRGAAVLERGRLSICAPKACENGACTACPTRPFTDHIGTACSAVQCSAGYLINQYYTDNVGFTFCTGECSTLAQTAATCENGCLDCDCAGPGADSCEGSSWMLECHYNNSRGRGAAWNGLSAASVSLRPPTPMIRRALFSALWGLVGCTQSQVAPASQARSPDVAPHSPAESPSRARSVELRACAAVRHWPTPSVTVLAGATRAHCARSGSERICKVAAEEGTDRIEWDSGGAQVTSHPARAYLGDTDGFDVAEVDLDADGESETVIANFDSIGNGLAPARWTLLVYAGKAPDVRFLDELSVEDYGYGSFVAGATPSSCDLLETSWRELDGDPRGPGYYLTARVRRLDAHGALVAPSGSRWIVRRLLQSFEQEYTTNDGRPYASVPRPSPFPAAWLASEETEQRDL